MADSQSRVPCDPTEGMCSDGKTVLCDLPCGGCDVCQSKHEQWSSFHEVDGVVPLMARRVNIDLRKLQLDDPDLAHFSPLTVRNQWLQWDQLVLDNGVLYRKWHNVKKKTPPCLLLVVSKSLQDTVLNSLHCNLIARHLGVKKTSYKIKQKFYWYRPERQC